MILVGIVEGVLVRVSVGIAVVVPVGDNSIAETVGLSAAIIRANVIDSMSSI